MLCRTLIPDFQSSAMGQEGGPDVLACQTFAHLPRFIEYRDRAIRFDLANKVNASGGNRQRIGQLSQLRGGQALLWFAALRLLRRRPGQPGRGLVGHIPVHKGRAGLTHPSERSKSSSLPKGVCPQAIQLFDLAIAFGFGDGQKDQFDAQIQTQPNELPEDARRLVATTEGGIVVELQKVRDSQGFPGVQTMPDHGRAAFVGRNGLRAGARPQVQCVKGIDLGTVFQIATRPIPRMQDSIDRRQGFGNVRRGGRARRGKQVALLQDPVDRGQRWGLLPQHFAQFASDRTRPPQAYFLLDQTAACSDNQAHNVR